MTATATAAGTMGRVTLPRPEDTHTTEQAAAALDVPAVVIRSWYHRDQAAPADFLPPRASGGRWRPLWALEELRPLADRYHVRKARRHAEEDGLA